MLENSEVISEQYDNALRYVEKKVSILYKRKSCEVNIRIYNTVMLKLVKSNMNLQFLLVYMQCLHT